VLPQASVWQELRQRALDTVPAGCGFAYLSPPTLDDWLQLGAYSVIAASKKGFTLHASSSDVGSALLSEALYSADNAMEHAVMLRNQFACHRWRSPAWTAVTFYYWGFHLAVGLTRLLGKTSWYISPYLASRLGLIAGTAAAQPGSGPYVLECESLLSATQREIKVRRGSQTRVHDAVWSLWFAELRECTRGMIANKAGGDEARLYLSLTRSANILGDSWPSDLRNELNYTTASGYGAIRKAAQSNVYGMVSADSPATVEEMIARLEANIGGLTRGHEISTQIPAATRVLIDSVFAMDMLLRMLLDEVSQRRQIDRRWLNARSAFAKHHANEFTVLSWPCRENKRRV